MLASARRLAAPLAVLVAAGPVLAQACPGLTATHEGALTPAAPSSSFGGVVSLSGDWALVGQFGPNLGEASFYERTASGWVLRTTENSARSPRMVGDVAMLGRDAFYIGVDEFVRVGQTWTFSQKVSLWGPDNHDDPGYGVAFDGQRVAVGAPDLPVFGGIGWGGIEVQELSGGAWSYQSLQTGLNSLQVGKTMDISGRWLVSNGHDQFFTEAHAVVFDLNTNKDYVFLPEGQNVSAMCVEGDTLVLGANMTPRDGTTTPVGKVFFFEFDGTEWQRGPELQPADLVQDDWFGSGIALDGNRLVVGATGVDIPPGNNDGAAYVFERVGDAWIELGRITLPGTQRLGRGVSLDGDRVVLGAVGEAHAHHLAVSLPPTSYCTAGTTASGCNALMSATGVASRSAATGFVLQVTGSEGQKDGTLYFGTAGTQANPWGNGTSLQCVVPPVTRTGVLSGTGAPGTCAGSFQLDFNAWMTANPGKAPQVGETVHAQCWFRDPANTSNQSTSLSDALAFSMCP